MSVLAGVEASASGPRGFLIWHCVMRRWNWQCIELFLTTVTDITSTHENRENCIANSFVADSARKFAQGHWSFLGPGSEKKWNGTHVYKTNGEWDEVADVMIVNFSEGGHPVFEDPVLLKEEI